MTPALIHFSLKRLQKVMNKCLHYISYFDRLFGPAGGSKKERAKYTFHICYSPGRCNSEPEYVYASLINQYVIILINYCHGGVYTKEIAISELWAPSILFPYTRLDLCPSTQRTFCNLHKFILDNQLKKEKKKKKDFGTV